MKMRFNKPGINADNKAVLKSVPVSACKNYAHRQWIIRRKFFFQYSCLNTIARILSNTSLTYSMTCRKHFELLS